MPCDQVCLPCFEAIACHAVLPCLWVSRIACLDALSYLCVSRIACPDTLPYLWVSRITCLATLPFSGIHKKEVRAPALPRSKPCMAKNDINKYKRGKPFGNSGYIRVLSQ